LQACSSAGSRSAAAGQAGFKLRIVDAKGTYCLRYDGGSSLVAGPLTEEDLAQKFLSLSAYKRDARDIGKLLLK